MICKPTAGSGTTSAGAPTSHLFWPAEPYRDDRSILVAGCGTTQAAHYALRWPRAQVVGIDVSAKSIAFTQGLKRKYALANLEVRQLAVERAAELGRSFDHVVCTGVLHHLPDPDAGLRALHDVLAADGRPQCDGLCALWPRRASTCCRTIAGAWASARRRLKSATSPRASRRCRRTIRLRRCCATRPTSPTGPGWPMRCCIRGTERTRSRSCSTSWAAPAWRSGAGCARRLICRGAARWRRRRITPGWLRLTAEAQYAAIELFRGTMVRHAVVAYRKDRPAPGAAIDFDGEAWLGYMPIRLPDTLAVRERLPPGAAAVLINRNHTYTDLYLPIDARQERLLAAIDGERTIAEICREPGDRSLARDFFQQLWRWDQVVFDTSRGSEQDPNQADGGDDTRQG